MAQAKKGVLDAVAKKAAGKILNKMEKKAAKINAKTAAKAAAYPAKQAAKTAKAEVKAAKKAASKEIKNAGKAGSRYTEKVTVGPKTRDKMAKGKFGSKVKQGPAATQKSTSTGTVKVVPPQKRDAFYNLTEGSMTWKRGEAKRAAEARRAASRSSR